jgi:hypothetical protein
MRRWWVRPWLWAVAAVLLALVLVSPHVGRAEPSGNYRPPLPAAALATGCYPLPAGMSLDFPYQVRSDGDVGQRRRLVLQYDQVDKATVVSRLGAALARAGLPADSATVTAYPRIPSDSVVRGQIVLDLPQEEVKSHDPQCDNPFSTKRFPPSWAPSTHYP